MWDPSISVFYNCSTHVWHTGVIAKLLKIKTICKKDDKSELADFWGISLVSVDCKFLSEMMHFKPRDAVDKMMREE